MPRRTTRKGKRPNGRPARPAVKSAPPKAVDARRLVHELEVHQIELRMQNEELKVARAEVEGLLTRYTDLFDFAPIGYARLDVEGRILEINHCGSQLLGRDRSALIAKRFQAFIAEGDVVAFDLACHSETAPGVQRRCEVSLARDPSMRVNLTFTTHGKPATTILIAFEDVTQERVHEEALARSERALREADRRKDDFIAMLSHELRNPLMPIRLGLRVIARATPGSEETRRAEAILERQVGHLSRLVDDLLDVTRVARGKIQLHRQRVELGDLVRRAVEDELEMFKVRGITPELSVGLKPAWVDADPVRMVQIISNLLGNAAKFTAPGGTVACTLSCEGARAILQVRDSGSGIAPDLMEHLFEPFSQGPQQLDRDGGGLGLGLALVKGLVEMHGGRVEVYSAGLGQGAEFSIELPLVGAPTDRAIAGPTRAPRPMRVLVIDDNEDSAEVLCEALKLSGHEVRMAYDGPAGIREAHEFRPEVVLCDIGLPGMNGYAVAQAFRADDELRGTYLVALTGYALPAAVQSAAAAGFDQHVAKPPSLEGLNLLLAEIPGRMASPSFPTREMLN